MQLDPDQPLVIIALKQLLLDHLMIRRLLAAEVQFDVRVDKVRIGKIQRLDHIVAARFKSPFLVMAAR